MPKICANDILNRLLISSRFPATTIPVITVSAQTGHEAFTSLAPPYTVYCTCPSNYSRLNHDSLHVIRNTLLIIDEVSMVSSLTLLYIHLQLTQVMTNQHILKITMCNCVVFEIRSVEEVDVQSADKVKRDMQLTYMQLTSGT